MGQPHGWPVDRGPAPESPRPGRAGGRAAGLAHGAGAHQTGAMATGLRYCRRCRARTAPVTIGPRWLPSWPIEVVVDLVAGRPHCLACRERHAKDVLRALSRETPRGRE